ncbi:hypothetical protein F5888DRAFT_1853697 [Russula emetica]|nr:hypothetical protein F5888DRAFT_1853697 [Russula emetica]
MNFTHVVRGGTLRTTDTVLVVGLYGNLQFDASFVTRNEVRLRYRCPARDLLPPSHAVKGDEYEAVSKSSKAEIFRRGHGPNSTREGAPACRHFGRRGTRSSSVKGQRIGRRHPLIDAVSPRILESTTPWPQPACTIIPRSPRQACRTICIPIPLGPTHASPSWRLWHLQNLMVDVNSAKSKREFKTAALRRVIWRDRRRMNWRRECSDIESEDERTLIVTVLGDLVSGAQETSVGHAGIILAHATSEEYGNTHHRDSRDHEYGPHWDGGWLGDDCGRALAATGYGTYQGRVSEQEKRIPTLQCMSSATTARRHKPQKHLAPR